SASRGTSSTPRSSASASPTSRRSRSKTSRCEPAMSLPLLLAALPLLYWPQGVDTAPALKQAGIARIAVPPEQAAAWRAAGLAVVEIAGADLAARTLLPAPGIV